jgi:hypothetical protein
MPQKGAKNAKLKKVGRIGLLLLRLLRFLAANPFQIKNSLAGSRRLYVELMARP